MSVLLVSNSFIKNLPMTKSSELADVMDWFSKLFYWHTQQSLPWNQGWIVAFSSSSSSSLTVVEPRVGHTMNQLSPCFSVECLVEQLSHAKSSPWCDVVDPICLRPATSSRSRNHALNNFLFQTFPIFWYDMPKISHFPLHFKHGIFCF